MYHDYATSKAQADASEKFKKECSELATIKEALTCFSNAVESAREPQRSEEDLYAQKQMGQWAFWLLLFTVFIGVISIGVTVVGIFYVRGTLLEMELQRGVSQDAVDAATEGNKNTVTAMKAERRPWVKIAEIKTLRLDLSDGPFFNVSLLCKYKNVGNSPARRVLTTSKILFSPTLVVPWDVITERAQDPYPYASFRENAVFPNDVGEHEVGHILHNLNQAGPSYCYILVTVFYWFADYPETHRTSRLLQIVTRYKDGSPKIVFFNPEKIKKEGLIYGLEIDNANTGDYAD